MPLGGWHFPMGYLVLLPKFLLTRWHFPMGYLVYYQVFYLRDGIFPWGTFAKKIFCTDFSTYRVGCGSDGIFEKHTILQCRKDGIFCKFMPSCVPSWWHSAPRKAGQVPQGFRKVPSFFCPPYKLYEVSRTGFSPESCTPKCHLDGIS